MLHRSRITLTRRFQYPIISKTCKMCKAFIRRTTGYSLCKLSVRSRLRYVDIRQRGESGARRTFGESSAYWRAEREDACASPVPHIRAALTEHRYVPRRTGRRRHNQPPSRPINRNVYGTHITLRGCCVTWRLHGTWSYGILILFKM